MALLPDRSDLQCVHVLHHRQANYRVTALLKDVLVLCCILNTSGKYIFCNSKLYIGTSCNYKPKFKLSQHKTLFCPYQYERSILDFSLNFGYFRIYSLGSVQEEMVSHQKSLKEKLELKKLPYINYPNHKKICEILKSSKIDFGRNHHIGC